MLAAAPAHAAELSSSAKTEIDRLLDRLGTSECEFYRNGSWYSGPEARHHLQMKLKYLVKKGLITNAEEFIEKAGTKSSFSGQPYKVRCPNQQEQPSAVWLGDELRHIREEHSQGPVRRGDAVNGPQPSSGSSALRISSQPGRHPGRSWPGTPFSSSSSWPSSRTSAIAPPTPSTCSSSTRSFGTRGRGGDGSCWPSASSSRRSSPISSP